MTPASEQLSKRQLLNTHTRVRLCIHTILFSRTNINSRDTKSTFKEGGYFPGYSVVCLPAQKGSLWSCGAVATLSSLKNHQPDFGSISVNLRAHFRTMFFNGQSQAILSLRRIFEIRGMCVSMCFSIFLFFLFFLEDFYLWTQLPSHMHLARLGELLFSSVCSSDIKKVCQIHTHTQACSFSV